jgi:hypothetical protein
MATISGIRVNGYNFDVEYDFQSLDIQRVYVGYGGIDVWPILCDNIKLKIFDEVFKSVF